MRPVVVLLWIGLVYVLVDAAASSSTESIAREADPEPRSLQLTFIPPFPTPTRTPTPINIGNFVWNDIDGDGRQDAGEPGIAGVTVQLWNARKQPSSTTPSPTPPVFTPSSPRPRKLPGRVLLPGGIDHSPRRTRPAATTSDSDIDPTGDRLRLYRRLHHRRQRYLDYDHDAGIVMCPHAHPTRTPTPINIGNFVWHDLNANGVQDVGEPGIQYVQVQLWNSAKTQLLDTAVTTATGIYTVTAPVPGDYRVRVLLPPVPGVAFALKDAVADDQTDSDINAAGVNVGFTDVITLASNVISTTIHDAGLTGYTSFTPTPTITNTPTVTNTPAIADSHQHGTVTLVADPLGSSPNRRSCR